MEQLDSMVRHSADAKTILTATTSMPWPSKRIIRHVCLALSRAILIPKDWCQSLHDEVIAGSSVNQPDARNQVLGPVGPNLRRNDNCSTSGTDVVE